MTTSPPSRTFKTLRNVALLATVVGAGYALRGLARTEASSSQEPVAPQRVFATPDVVLPKKSIEARALAALAQNRPEEARRLLKPELERATEPVLGRLRYLWAKATPDIDEARPVLEALANSDSLLAGWGRLRLTERLRERDPNAAADSATLLMTQPLFRARAEQLLALSLYNAGRYDEAEPMLRSLVSEASERSAALNVTLPLAAIVSQKPDLDSQRFALSLYRRVLTRAPLNEAAQQARAAVQNLLSAMPAAQRIALAELSADEAFAEAEALVHARDYSRAVDRYSAIAKRFKGDPKSVCDARLAQGKAYFSARRNNEALVVFEDVVRLCRSADHRAEAHYQAGRVLVRRGDPRGAVAHYDAVAHDFPSNRWADDSLLAAAHALMDLGDAAGVRSRLRALLALRSSGELRSDAHFLLAWLERSEKQYAAALAEFDALIKEGTGERAEDLVGRTEYWRARTLMNLERREDAEAAFLALFRARPLSYYGQQALARIREIDGPLAVQLVADLREPPPEGNERQQPLRLPARPEMEKVEFKRATELLRVSEPAAAVEELEFMGCFRPDSPDELYLLCAALLSEFGAESHATTLARRRTTRVLNQPPRGQALALWRVVYPRAFSGILDDAAKKAEVPAAFVRAVAREESSFDPNAVSPANAYGLIQLIRPTARTYAGPLKLPSDIDSLKNPEINLRIGAAFMHSLFERYKQNMAVVPAAYNAGPGAADRWVRERGSKMALDEWIESIPYTETRRYTRRVLQSYAAYSWLDEGQVPPLLPELYKVAPTVATRPSETKRR